MGRKRTETPSSRVLSSTGPVGSQPHPPTWVSYGALNSAQPCCPNAQGCPNPRMKTNSCETAPWVGRLQLLPLSLVLKYLLHHHSIMESKSLHYSHQQVNWKWVLESPRPTTFLHVGGGAISYPRAPPEGPSEGRQAWKTFRCKKPGGAQIPPTQTPYPSIIISPLPPLEPAGKLQSFTESMDEKPHFRSGWGCELYQKALNCQASTCIFYADYSGPDSLGISLGSHRGTLIN